MRPDPPEFDPRIDFGSTDPGDGFLDSSEQDSSNDNASNIPDKVQEPSQLVITGHVSPTPSKDPTSESATTAEIKVLAKELDQQDWEIKQQQKETPSIKARGEAPHDVQKRQHKSWPHEKFGRQGTPAVPTTAGQQARQRRQFPHKKFRTTANSPAFADDDDDRRSDDLSSSTSSKSARQAHDVEGTLMANPIVIDEQPVMDYDNNVENLIEASLVTMQTYENSNNNQINIYANIPEAEIVTDLSITSKFIPASKGSKVLCFSLILVLAAALCVGVACGNGKCTPSVATDQPTIVITEPPTTRPAPISGSPTSEPATSAPITSISLLGKTVSTTIRHWELYDAALKGTISSEIGYLSSLTYLDLGLNQILGTIPSELGLLTELNLLQLGDNNLSGMIPTELGFLTQLTYLSLEANYLSGPIPSQLGLLTQLAEIFFWVNTLSGNIPSQLGLLTQLNWLGLGQNKLNGTIPSQLGSLSLLARLYLDTNQLSGTMPSQMMLLTHLTLFLLHETQISGSIPSELGLLTKMNSLHFRGAQFSGTIPTELGLLTMLTDLTLNSNQLSGSISSELGLLTQLMVGLWLSENQLSGTIPSQLGLLTHLTDLRLHSNKLSGTVPSSLCTLKSLEVEVDEQEVTCPVGCAKECN